MALKSYPASRVYAQCPLCGIGVEENGTRGPVRHGYDGRPYRVSNSQREGQGPNTVGNRHWCHVFQFRCSLFYQIEGENYKKPPHLWHVFQKTITLR
jgi:hypothetical protein